MTTESDFFALLDACPSYYLTLRVFADWLRDRDDSRADGYAALGALRRVPEYTNMGWCFWCHVRKKGSSFLRGYWWDKFRQIRFKDTENGVIHSPTPHEAFDAAARAFALLTPEEQTAILAKVPVTT